MFSGRLPAIRTGTSVALGMPSSKQTINSHTKEREVKMRKLLIVAALALGACGGSNTGAPNNLGNQGNPNNGGNPAGNGAYTYPQACSQFCQVISTRALDCVVGQGRWTQQDLQTVIGNCNRAAQASQPSAQDCNGYSAQVNAATCSQICNLVGQHC
jgi:hypothetical protein